MKLSMLESEHRPNPNWAGTSSRYERTYQKQEQDKGGPGRGGIDLDQPMGELLDQAEGIDPKSTQLINELRQKLFELWPEYDKLNADEVETEVERLKQMLSIAVNYLDVEVIKARK